MLHELIENKIEGRRLGRRAPANKPALRLARYLVKVPEHPTMVDHFSKVHDWGLYRNDRYGDCGPTSVANSLKLITKYSGEKEFSASQNDVFDLYKKSGNPHFDPNTDADDNGVVMQIMLESLMRGGIGGKRPLAFAEVNPKNFDEIRAAISIFGCVLLGVTLETAQQSQPHVWDYKNTGIWGGHAVMAGFYTSDISSKHADISVISWATRIGMTDTFMRHQLDEAWVVIWPEHMKHPAFQDGIDLQSLKADYKNITGRDL